MEGRNVPDHSRCDMLAHRAQRLSALLPNRCVGEALTVDKMHCTCRTRSQIAVVSSRRSPTRPAGSRGSKASTPLLSPLPDRPRSERCHPWSTRERGFSDAFASIAIVLALATIALMFARKTMLDQGAAGDDFCGALSDFASFQREGQ